MLQSQPMYAYIPAKDVARARRYEQIRQFIQVVWEQGLNPG